MDTPNSNAMPIDHGPMAGWDITITHIPHGIDAMDDLYVLDLWAPGADTAAHTFETYRYAYGWNTLNTALGGRDNAMQAALEWWTANNTTPAYAAHRILVAIDATTWATRAEIANHLAMDPSDLDVDQPYGRALAAIDQHNLTSWRNTRPGGRASNFTTLIALSPAAYDLIHPDDATTASKSQQWFASTFNARAPITQTAGGARPTAAQSFPRIPGLHPAAATPIGKSSVPSQRPSHPTR